MSQLLTQEKTFSHKVSCVKNIIRKSKPTSTTPAPKKEITKTEKPETEQNIVSDSDATIIYTPPVSPRQKVKKGKAIFKIRLVGIKRPSENEEFKIQKMNALLRKCVYTCFLCGEKFPSTKTFNAHFKNTHNGLTCRDCDREFNNPYP